MLARHLSAASGSCAAQRILKREHSVTLGPVIAGAEGVPPAPTASDERVERYRVVLGIADQEFVEPYTKVQEPIAAVLLENPDGVRNAVISGTPVEADAVAPL